MISCLCGSCIHDLFLVELTHRTKRFSFHVNSLIVVLLDISLLSSKLSTSVVRKNEW